MKIPAHPTQAQRPTLAVGSANVRSRPHKLVVTDRSYRNAFPSPQKSKKTIGNVGADSRHGFWYQCTRDTHCEGRFHGPRGRGRRVCRPQVRGPVLVKTSRACRLTGTRPSLFVPLTASIAWPAGTSTMRARCASRQASVTNVGRWFGERR